MGIEMFTTDSRTETFLTQMGVVHEYTNNVTYQALKPGWENRNIARPTPQRTKAPGKTTTLKWR